jgi:hypothetical protein
MAIRYMLAGAVLMASFGAGGIAHAQTISFADAATALTQECGADIKKLCKGINLGNDQIQKCLEKHQAKVTPTCISTLTDVTASIERRLVAQASVFKVCGAAAATLCKGVKGGRTSFNA